MRRLQPAIRKMHLQEEIERVLSVISKLLENRPLEQVATETDISGPLEGPRTDTLQTIANLIRNAFFEAILPGFEREVRHGQRKR